MSDQNEFSMLSQRVLGAILVISEPVGMSDGAIVALPETYHIDLDSNSIEEFIKNLKELPQVFQVSRMSIKLNEGEK